MAKKILVIEDDTILQKAIKEALDNAGYEVVQAFDGVEGEEKLKDSSIDLIILDLVLPKQDGWELLKKISNKQSGLNNAPVVVLTAISTAASIEECKKYGAVEYLSKSDYDLKEVLEKIAIHIK